MENSDINILLVDDRADGLLALEAVLSQDRYSLVKASSGAQAISLLAEREFALILLDVQMPEMDGFQAAALIKRNPLWRDIPILFVTAIHKDTPYIYQGYEAGAVDYLFKPFDPYILRAKVGIFADLHRKNIRIRQAQEELRRKEEELYQTRKLEAIGRLAGGVAHDFNNIVTGILGISEELRIRFLSDETSRGELEEIIKASHRAFSLTRQLLAYARRQVISPELLDLNQVILDMRGMISRLIGEDVQLVTDLEPGLGPVNADRGYLEQVLINLVLNSRDAMTNGGMITVQTSNTELTDGDISQKHLQLTSGSYIVLAVRDTGCGMTPEVLEHVFEPFFTTKEKHKGTGLGLATVYGIVKQNGGDITVQSQWDYGTRVDIYLPRAVAQAAPALTVIKPTTTPNGSETVLVVEDDRLVRRVVTSQLRRLGYKVLEATDGPDAIALVEQYEGLIHLMITDVVMPEMNGHQLVNIITVKRPGIAVLYMSGYTEEVIAHRGVLEPGICFIEKSRLSSELPAKIRHALANRTRDSSAVSSAG